MDDLPPLLNERQRDLGPRPVGTPYVIGGAMMFVNAIMNGVNGYLAPKLDAAQGMSGSGGPGFGPGIFFYVAIGVGLIAGSPVARVAGLIMIGLTSAYIAGFAYNDVGRPPRAEILSVWPAPDQTTAAALAPAINGWPATSLALPATGPRDSIGTLDFKPAYLPTLPHGKWPLYAAAAGFVLGFALMLTPPPVGIKSYLGAVLSLAAHGLSIWGIYIK